MIRIEVETDDKHYIVRIDNEKLFANIDLEEILKRSFRVALHELDFENKELRDMNKELHEQLRDAYSRHI